MARELGMNPRKLGSLANHKQEPWKAPLPVFIEQIYRKRFGKTQPDRVVTIEERVQELAAKKAEKRERRNALKLSVRNNSINRNENRRSRIDGWKMENRG